LTLEQGYRYRSSETERKTVLKSTDGIPAFFPEASTINKQSLGVVLNAWIYGVKFKPVP